MDIVTKNRLAEIGLANHSPSCFPIVRTAGASPAELTNEKSYVWFFTKFIASCPSLLALISAAGANPVGKSLPIMFAIVRTAGASPAELTNE